MGMSAVLNALLVTLIKLKIMEEIAVCMKTYTTKHLFVEMAIIFVLSKSVRLKIIKKMKTEPGFITDYLNNLLHHPHILHFLKLLNLITFFLNFLFNVTRQKLQ